MVGLVPFGCRTGGRPEPAGPSGGRDRTGESRPAGPTLELVGRPGSEATLPRVAQEFRALWIATVDNIDWPSRPGLSPDQQVSELRAILDAAVAARMNAVVLQVRPAADALYESRLEPWSPVLTGTMGRSPGYDPLRTAITEAHARGLELHAWFNPFRARPKGAPPAGDARHLSRAHPDWIRNYAGQQWLDPGLPQVRERALSVIADVVRRYDVDGVHIDDYFYPYPERNDRGRAAEFPDWQTYQRHGRSSGLSLSDWRRQNIDGFVRGMYQTVKSIRPTAKVSVSPFGIWRPGHPAGVRGLDAYESCAADARLWLQRGWVDILAPQLYWPIQQPGQRFDDLMGWWRDQNVRGRLVCPGIAVHRVRTWPAQEIASQIELGRRLSAGGFMLFSARPLLEDRGGVRSLLTRGVFAGVALPPRMAWLPAETPGAPRLRASRQGGWTRAAWEPSSGRARWWLVRFQAGGRWAVSIRGAAQTSFDLREEEWGAVTRLAVSGVDASGNIGPPTIVEIR